MVWPNQKRQILAVVLLMIVFPAYGKQWVALTHVNQKWTALLAYILSLGMTAWALRNPSKRVVRTVLALALMGIGLFSTEYFFGPELSRGLSIPFMASEESPRARLLCTLKRWRPYLLLGAANALYLRSYYNSGAYQSYLLSGILSASGSRLQSPGRTPFAMIQRPSNGSSGDYRGESLLCSLELPSQPMPSPFRTRAISSPPGR